MPVIFHKEIIMKLDASCIKVNVSNFDSFLEAQEVCEEINYGGAKFAIVYNGFLDPDAEYCTFDQVHYALVVTESGNVMPFPILEEALGEKFLTWEEGQKSWSEYDQWLETRFSDQWVGDAWYPPKDWEVADRRKVVEFVLAS
jgi:hypothetical protein